MSLVGEHLERQGVPFEAMTHTAYRHGARGGSCPRHRCGRGRQDRRPQDRLGPCTRRRTGDTDSEHEAHPARDRRFACAPRH